MKKVQKSMLDKLASVSKFAAVKAAGSVSCAGFHQPKEPKALHRASNRSGCGNVETFSPKSSQIRHTKVCRLNFMHGIVLR